MEQINKLLITLGLSSTESSIYLSGLSLSAPGVKEIEKITQIKRPTIYHALSTLAQKGLVSKIDVGSRTIFKMVPPESLQKLIKNKIKKLEKEEKSLNEIIPILRQKIGSVKSEKAIVSHFEGIEGIKIVVEEALYCQSRLWDIIAPQNNFFSEFDKDYAAYFMEARKRKNITARTLWELGARSRLLTLDEKKYRQVRFLPQNMLGKFKSVIILFDNKVAIISSFAELNAILIQSQEIHDTMRAMFEGLWETSSEYEKIR